MSRTFLFNGIILFRNVLRMEVLTIVNEKTGVEWEAFYRGLEKRKNRWDIFLNTRLIFRNMSDLFSGG